MQLSLYSFKLIIGALYGHGITQKPLILRPGKQNRKDSPRTLTKPPPYQAWKSQSFSYSC
jgi:hypothetical protein